MIRALPLLLAALALAPAAHADSQTGKFGDQGDGTYRNPIIAADYSDPDVIRVGADYYMVTSTFQYSPGVAVLQSKDLVNWRTIGAAIADTSKISPRYNWDRMSMYNEGVYAPSIRHHDGKFWVFVNCHGDGGFWMATATNPAGPWTATQIKDKNGKPLRAARWTDPCPFWDDDGKAYLASSHPGSRWFGYLFQMTPDGTQLLDADVDAMNKSDGPYAPAEGGTLISPFHSTEGHKLFKRHGLYYLQHIEFLDKGQGHGTYIFRSKNLYGTKPDGTPGKPGDPGTYDVLKFSDDLPGQGGFVDTPDGRWFWIAQFNRMDVDGRPPHLLPVTWIDEWPVVGVNIKDLKGHFAWQLPKPIPSFPATLPQGSDDFNLPTLDPQWAWNYQPRASFWSLTERPGTLRLRAFKPLKPGQFFKVGNVLLQRHVQSDSTVTTVKFDLAGLADGQEAGLAHFNGGKNYATIAVVQQNGVRTLKYEEDGQTPQGVPLPLPANAVSLWLRSTVGVDALVAYSFSHDGKTFTPFGGSYKARQGNYRGDQVGLYTFNATAEAGYIDIDFFHYEATNR